MTKSTQKHTKTHRTTYKQQVLKIKSGKLPDLYYELRAINVLSKLRKTVVHSRRTTVYPQNKIIKSVKNSVKNSVELME